MTLRSTARHAILVLIVGIAAYSGLVGIDFGRHWDEPERIGTLIHARERGELLPNWYNYPSVVHDLLVVSAAPELITSPSGIATNPPVPGGSTLTSFLTSQTFLLRARSVFCCISIVSVLATYIAVWRWRRDVLEAATAAALLGFSWQLGYHARWIAPDALAATSASVCICLLVEARRTSGSLRWLAAAAAAAGVGCGTKYPSGLLLLPCLIEVLRSARSLRSRLGRSAWVGVTFVLAFLVTTPGTLLQHKRFVTDVGIELHHYATGHGGGHSISPGFPHLMREVEYLSLAAFSPYWGFSMLAFAMAVVGIVSLARDRWRLATLVGFPIAYVAFMGLQRVMMARNLLVVFPFLAMLGAVGAGAVRRHVSERRRWLGIAWTAVLGGMLTFNAIYLVSAGLSSRPERGRTPEQALLSRLQAGLGKSAALSGRVGASIAKLAPNAPASVAGSGSAAPIVALYCSEVRDPNRWVANVPGYFLEVFGSREVDLTYYPGWMGRDHIVLVRRQDAEKLLAPFDGSGPGD